MDLTQVKETPGNDLEEDLREGRSQSNLLEEQYKGHHGRGWQEAVQGQGRSDSRMYSS